MPLKANIRFSELVPRRLHLVVLLLAALMVASLVYQQKIFTRFLEEQQLHASSQAVLATLGHLEADLLFAQESARRLAGLMSFSGSDLALEPGSLEALIEENDDGVRRSRRGSFDARKEAGIWIPASVNLDERTRKHFLRAWRLTNLFGQASFSERLVDAWVLPLTNGEVIFYPDAPNFVFNAGRDTDYRTTDWVKLADPAQNPQGDARWTKAAFDPVAGAWMVSVVVPYFEDGVWAGTVGHDLLLSELFSALVVKSQVGSRGLLPLYVVTKGGDLLLKDVAMPGQGEKIPAEYAPILARASPRGLVAETLGDDTYLMAPIPALDATVIYRLSGALNRAALGSMLGPLQWISGVLMLLLGMLGYGVLAEDRQRRQQQRAALEGRNRELAEMVAVRTSELAAANQQLEAMMLQDHLTGLGNRRAFDQTLERVWATAQRSRQCFSVVMLDVDHFKGYNDALGHPAGDACLRTIGRVIKESARRPEDVALRYGGEEFALILPDTDLNGALQVAELLRLMVMAQQLPHPRNAAGIVTISLGVASLNFEQDKAPADLLARADAALYRAKQGGRNRSEADRPRHLPSPEAGE